MRIFPDSLHVHPTLYCGRMSGWQIFFSVLALLVALAGLTMAFARTPPDAASSSLSQWADRLGIKDIPQWLRDRSIGRLIFRWAAAAMFCLIFVLGFGLGMLRNSSAPSVTPILASTMSAPSEKTDLNWSDSLYIESILFSMPKPCLIKLTYTNGANRNSRNILAAIIDRNNSCDILDNMGDSRQEFEIDVDNPQSNTVTGLIIRYANQLEAGLKMANSLKGNFCHITVGHMMPPDSPPNLIWIVVGDGYPWVRDGLCRD